MKTGRLLLALSLLGLALPIVARAEDQPLEVQIVAALNKAFGQHPGFRANHAKGVVVEGSFTASPAAAALSKAILFDGSTIPVTVRFSDSTGIPNLPDGSDLANPHGMAIKYHLPDGSETDMVTNSLKFFLVSTGEEFRDLLLAVAASPADAANPTKLEQFVATHPRCRPPSPPWPRRTASPTRSTTASMPSSSSTRPASGRRCATDRAGASRPSGSQPMRRSGRRIS